MRIAINLRFVISGRLEGIGWFSWETARRMARDHPEHEFVFLFDRRFDPAWTEPPNVEGRIVRPPARHPILWWLWFEIAIPRALRKVGADLFLSPDGFCSLRTEVPQYLVIHDLAFEHFKEHVPAAVGRYYRRYTPRYAARARRIAAVSRATKEDLVARYRVEPEKIDVVYNGASERFRPLSRDERRAARKAFAGGLSYFVYVGALQPRKNIANLFRAFDLYREKGGDHQLLMAGRMAWKTESIRQAFKQMQHGAHVRFAGHLDTDRLARALGGAEALVYPSLLEGFGIPILESMQAGVPVITSDRSSMPEVSGEAALLVNPENPVAIAAAMSEIEEDEELRGRLRRDGLERAKRFSWDRTAAGLWDSLMKIAPLP